MYYLMNIVSFDIIKSGTYERCLEALESLSDTDDYIAGSLDVVSDSELQYIFV